MRLVEELGVVFVDGIAISVDCESIVVCFESTVEVVVVAKFAFSDGAFDAWTHGTVVGEECV